VDLPQQDPPASASAAVDTWTPFPSAPPPGPLTERSDVELAILAVGSIHTKNARRQLRIRHASQVGYRRAVVVLRMPRPRGGSRPAFQRARPRDEAEDPPQPPRRIRIYSACVLRRNWSCA
jgi:hypothetical protein